MATTHIVGPCGCCTFTSSPGGGASPMVTNCRGVSVPQTLYLTITSGHANCNYLAGTYPVTWNGTNWSYEFVHNTCTHRINVTCDVSGGYIIAICLAQTGATCNAGAGQCGTLSGWTGGAFTDSPVFQTFGAKTIVNTFCPSCSTCNNVNGLSGATLTE